MAMMGKTNFWVNCPLPAVLVSMTEKIHLATPKKKKSAPSIRAVSSPKKEEKEEAHPKVHLPLMFT